MSYPCKFDHKPCFDKKKYDCSHGGGVGCRKWKEHTAEEMGWNNPLPNRSWSKDNGGRLYHGF
jgi:hypothetical protein